MKKGSLKDDVGATLVVAPVCAPGPPKGDHKGVAPTSRRDDHPYSKPSRGYWIASGATHTGRLTRKTSKLHALQYLFNAQLMSGFLHNDLPLLSP